MRLQQQWKVHVYTLDRWWKFRHIVHKLCFITKAENTEAVLMAASNSASSIAKYYLYLLFLWLVFIIIIITIIKRGREREQVYTQSLKYTHHFYHY